METEQVFDENRAHAGEADSKGVDLQQQHQANDRGVDLGADTDGVAEDEVFLELLDIGRRDVRVRQGAESGVDAVIGPLARLQALAHGPRGGDAVLGRGIEADGTVRPHQVADAVEREAGAGEQMRGRHGITGLGRN